MARAPMLESFDSTPADIAPPPVGPSPEWLDGHAAGLTEGQAVAEARHMAMRDTVVQAIADLEFRFAEARAHLLGGLVPLFAALTDRILPALLHDTLGQHILAALTEAAEGDLARPLLLALNPEDVGPVTRALAELHAPTIRVTVDPGMLPGQACLKSGPAETMLDGDTLLAEARAVLAAVNEDPNLRSHHG